MAYRKIVVPVTGGQRDATVLTAALDIAKTFESACFALSVRPDPSEALPFLGEGISAGVIQELLDSANEAAKKASALALANLKAACTAVGVPFLDRHPDAGRACAVFAGRQGLMSEVLTEEAALSDLVIFDGVAINDEPRLREGLETVLLTLRRPIMVLPERKWSAIGAKIAIGWDGGLAAAHAVSAAMPWLKRARAVEIINVHGFVANAPEMDRLRDYLKLQGLGAVEHGIQGSDQNAAEALTDAAIRAGADMLVMGGFGHSRMRELILGGVTRHVLNKVTMPVFMVH
jgi:nucleotide-binding universal stress UspA family protein